MSLPPLLVAEGLVAKHGLLVAVRAVDLTIGQGEVLAIAGANGAGKTTLLRAIAGAHRLASGRIRFAGDDVTALPAHRRTAAGIGLVPEGRRLFTDMTVLENLKVAAAARRSGLWTLERVLDTLPQLKPILGRRAGQISGGQQQAAAIGRALLTNPRLLMLDEVSLGLSPVAVDGVYAALPRLIEAGTTIVLVEQDLGRALAAATRIVCMLEGQIVLDEDARTVARADVTQAYFGLRRAGSS